VRVGEESLSPPDDARRRDHVARHHALHVGAQHLDGDVLAVVAGAVHLPQRRGGDRDGIPRVEQLAGALAVRPLDHALYRLRRDRGDPVGERRHGPEIRLGEQVGAPGEHLGDLDEARAEVCDRRHQRLGAAAVKRCTAPRRAPDDDPAPDVAPERQQERKDAQEHVERTHIFQ